MNKNSLIRFLASENKIMEVNDILCSEKDKISYLHLIVHALSQNNLDKSMVDLLIKSINNKPKEKLLNNSDYLNIPVNIDISDLISFVNNDMQDIEKIINEIKKNKIAEQLFLNYFNLDNKSNFTILFKKNNFVKYLLDNNNEESIKYFLYNTNINTLIFSYLICDKNFNKDFYYGALKKLCERDSQYEIDKYFNLIFFGKHDQYLNTINFVIKNANKETLRKTIKNLIYLNDFEPIIHMDDFIHMFLNNNIKTFEMSKFIEKNKDTLPLSSSFVLNRKINKKVKKELDEKIITKKRKM